MLIQSFLTITALVVATVSTVQAAISPTFPQPGTIETEGKSFDILWSFDGLNPEATFQIDFMTGSNSNQTVLKNVAKGVKVSALKHSFVPPKVSPNSAIYFFMFTGSDGSYYWTTRFGIVAPGGKLTAEPEKIEPNGDPIPWGTGKIVKSASKSNTTTVKTDTTTAPSSTTSTKIIANAADTASSDSSMLKPILTIFSISAVAAYFIM